MSAVPPGAYPRSVTPGIETHTPAPTVPPKPDESCFGSIEPGVWCRPDWIRFTAPDRMQGAVFDLLCDTFGDEHEAAPGAMWFKHGRLWRPGVVMSTGHRDGLCMVDVRGERLSCMHPDIIVDLLARMLDLGMKPTRIDIAIDWIGQSVRLYEHARASCKHSELCHLRRWASDSEFTANNHPTRLHLKLGKRDSAVCVRIYDKGLEQRIPHVGYWERLEAEFKEDRAITVAQALVDAGGQWLDTAVGFVLGAVDFRECNGRSELKRRPRCAWWEGLIAGHDPQRARPAPPESTFETWLGGFRRGYGARIKQLSERSGIGVGELVETLLLHVRAATDPSPVVAEFLRGL